MLKLPTSVPVKNLAAAACAALACLCAPGLALAADAEPAGEPSAAQVQRDASRAEIRAQRALIEQRQAQAQALCYQRFAVEDCLKDARSQAREQDKPLRERELQMNDTERRERAAQRMKDIEAKQADKAASSMKIQQREPSAQRDTEALRSQRAQEAQQRAAQQAGRERSHQAQQEQRQAGEPQRRSAARAEYEAKQKNAAERRARADKAALERGPLPAPLPTPP